MEAWSVLPTQSQPAGVRLADVLATTFPPTADIYATSCACDARAVRPGDAYFAPPGDATSVLKHAERAVAAGAKAVVVDQLLPLTGAPQFVVRDTRIAFGQFCHALTGHPGKGLAMVAIAGGHGKDAAAHLLRSIFAAAGQAASLSPRGATTAASYVSWLAETAASLGDAAITKVPARKANHHLHGAEFDVVCLTNLAAEDRRKHKSVASVRESLARICEQVTDSGSLVINADDQASCRLLAEWSGPATTFALNKPADVTATIVEQHTGGQVFLLRHENDCVAVDSGTIGRSHLYDCLAAAATALTLGADLRTIAAGLESAGGIPGCMQRVACGQTFPVYLDAASGTASIAGATETAAAVTTGRVLTVLGSDDRALDRQSLQAAHRGSDLVIATGQSTTEITAEPGVRLVEDRFSAIALAIALAEPGDTVLITGANIGTDSPSTGSPYTGSPSSDEQIVRQLLELRLANEPKPATVGISS